MSCQLTKETIVEWLKRCDYLKCSESHKNALIAFGCERLHSALCKLPLSGRISELAPESQKDLGFALMQHYFEVRESDGSATEDAKNYKQNIRCQDVQHANGYLSMMMRTVARELARPEYACDGIHNADGRKRKDKKAFVIFDQEIVDRYGIGGDESDRTDMMPSLTGGAGRDSDWDPEADIYKAEPSVEGDSSFDKSAVSKEAEDEAFMRKVASVAAEKIKEIRKLKNCGACYYILTSFDGDYEGILAKTSYYDGAKKIKEIILAGDPSLDLRRFVALRIQSFFENDWWNDSANAQTVAAIKRKREELRKLAKSAAYNE